MADATLTPCAALDCFELLAEGPSSAANLRQWLLASNITGWTERDIRGYWEGLPIDRQVEFIIYAAGTRDPSDRIQLLANCLLRAHAWRTIEPGEVFQLVHIAPDGARTLYEVSR